jgi:cell division protein FtsI/penicillin-binding protein 2
MANPSFQTRFKISAVFFLVLFAIVILRLIDLQIIRHDELTKKAEQQYVVTIELEPKRGDIYDRNMKPLATSLKVPSIYAVPKLISNNQKVVLAKILAKILNEKPQSVFKRIMKDKSFVWLKRKVTQEEAEKIKKIKNPNISMINETKRFYPGGSLVAQILGFCDIDNQGLEGLELHLNSYLGGRAGFRKTKRDARGREVPSMMIKEVPPVNGNNIILTIDEFIQHVTERELDIAFKKWNAKGATAIVMNPNTGEILAMASRPTYDLNQIQSAKTEARRNRAITDIFEPGSIFKIVTAASAYNEGLVKLTDTFFCENGEYYYKYKRVIHDVHPYGQLTFPQVIEK